MRLFSFSGSFVTNCFHLYVLLVLYLFLILILFSAYTILVNLVLSLSFSGLALPLRVLHDVDRLVLVASKIELRCSTIKIRNEIRRRKPFEIILHSCRSLMYRFIKAIVIVCRRLLLASEYIGLLRCIGILFVFFHDIGHLRLVLFFP